MEQCLSCPLSDGRSGTPWWPVRSGHFIFVCFNKKKCLEGISMARTGRIKLSFVASSNLLLSISMGFLKWNGTKWVLNLILHVAGTSEKTGTPSVRRIRQFVVFQMPGESKANVVPIKVRLFTMTIKELEAEYNFVSGLTWLYFRLLDFCNNKKCLEGSSMAPTGRIKLSFFTSSNLLLLISKGFFKLNGS